jgi:putative intracellular protease/amidase
MALLEDTKLLSDVECEAYDVLYFAGGHGAMWDFADNDDLHTVIREMYESGRVVSAVCPGTAALRNVRLSNGEYLIAGKQGTGFAHRDETIAGAKRFVPVQLEKRLKDRGMIYSSARLSLGGHAVADERLVTGQKPNSAKETAQKTCKPSVFNRPNPDPGADGVLPPADRDPRGEAPRPSVNGDAAASPGRHGISANT